MEKNIPLYLISGFLGSGKTTFLKQIISENPNSSIGIIMNEFGKISIDGPILQKDNLEMIELTRGSIFCSCLSLAFGEALIEMSQKPLDYVFVESSGLADPSNIGEILDGVSQVIHNPYKYSGSLHIVDGSQYLSQIKEVETVKRQTECADFTVINKTDLISKSELNDIYEILREINPSMEIQESSFFHALNFPLGKDFSAGKYPTLRSSLNTPENKPKTISLQFLEEPTKDRITAFLTELLPSAFRVKGFVQIQSEWWEVHGVGFCVDFYETSQKLDLSTLVIISKVGPEIIRIVDALCKKHFTTSVKILNG